MRRVVIVNGSSGSDHSAAVRLFESAFGSSAPRGQARPTQGTGTGSGPVQGAAEGPAET